MATQATCPIARQKIVLHRFAKFFLTFAGVCLFLAGTPGLSQELATGVLTTIWGDPPPGSVDPPTRIFYLTEPDGTQIRLSISDDVLAAAGGWSAVNNRAVTVAFAPPNEESLPLWEGRTVIVILSDSPSNAQPYFAPLVGTQKWISLPCRFSDMVPPGTPDPKDQAYFNAQYGNNVGELNHFWKTDSYNSINIDGSAAQNWVNLPSPRSTYVPQDNGCIGGTMANLNQLFDDCTAAHDPAVDFSNNIFGINLMFNADLDGCAWGGGRFSSLDGVGKVWPVTWEPPFGYGNNFVMEHENGHAYNLPHSTNWDNDGFPYDNAWDYLSNGSSFPAGNPYGFWGTGGMAYHKEKLNWLTGASIVTVSASTPFTTPGVVRVGDRLVQTIDLDPVAQTSGIRMISLPVAGGNKWVVEAREMTGPYESGLPGTAVIISHIDPTRREENWVFDADSPPADNNDNDGTMWTVGEKWTDSHANVAIGVPGYTAEGIEVEVLNMLGSGGFRVRITRPGGCTPLEIKNTTFTDAQTRSACKIIVENLMVLGMNAHFTARTQNFEARDGFVVGTGASFTMEQVTIP